MNFDLNKALSAIANNYLVHKDIVHHYVWTITLQEYRALLDKLCDMYKLLRNDIEIATRASDELIDVMVVHHKYVVVQVGLSQALYSKD